VIAKPAQYLLRFDDLCPTVSERRWERIQPLIEEFGVRPILAVIPDNRDYTLQISPPDPQFWSRIRALEARGAAVGLHGYQHLCNSRDGSLLPLHRHTEFANVDPVTQREWIRAGLQILRGQGLTPKLWVAPRHGFDWNTLEALRAEGITVLSDGFARLPVRRGGITWIPQQLWSPVQKSRGLWTICIHANTARGVEIDRLHEFLRTHAGQFTSVERVLAEFDAAGPARAELTYERLALWRAQFSYFRKRVLQRRRNHG